MDFTAVKRLMLLVAVGALTIFWAPTTSYALTELGDFCFQLSPFIDTLRLDISESDLSSQPSGPFQLLHGRWRAGGLYQVQVTGHLSETDQQPGRWALGITGTLRLNPPNNDVAALYADLDPRTLSGPFNIVALNTSPPVRNSGTLIPIACSATMGPISGVGPALRGAKGK